MRSGRVFIIIGILFLVSAVGLTGYNLWDDERAGEECEEVLTDLEEVIPERKERVIFPETAEDIPDYILDPNMEMPVKEIDGKEYVGTISIPVLEREFPVYNEWDLKKLKTAPCRYTGTAYMGNLVICAHNYTKHFGRLARLKYGDVVVFTDMDGNVFRYDVVEIETIDPYDIEGMKTGDWDLTLFTCTLGGKFRTTVRCKLSEEKMN